MKVELLKEKPENYPGLFLSVSKIKTFLQCPNKYRFTYIEKEPRKKKDYLTFGTFLHAILEDFYKHKINGSTLSNDVLMTQSFKTAMNSESLKNDLTKKQKHEAWAILNNYLIKIHNNLPNVIDVEKQFYVNINDEVLLNGLIDRIQMDNNILHIADYKTTKNTKFLMKDHLQLLVYAYVTSLEYTAHNKIKTSYILLKHNFESIEKTFTKQQLQFVANKILKYGDNIKNEKLWRPIISNLCKYCDYFNICETNKKTIDISYGETKW